MKRITIDLLQGLTPQQKSLIMFLCEQKNYNPMGFDVDVDNNRIFYMGQEVK